MENRVIKFRVYILDNSGKVKCYFHEWLDGDGWKHDYYAPIVSNGVFSHKELGDGFFGEIVRKRFSGLTDKHGVEIYEGDVGSKCYSASVKTGVVAWHQERAMFIFQDGYNEPLYQLPLNMVEVIGNVFANPELIN